MNEATCHCTRIRRHILHVLRCMSVYAHTNGSGGEGLILVHCDQLRSVFLVSYLASPVGIGRTGSCLLRLVLLVLSLNSAADAQADDELLPALDASLLAFLLLLLCCRSL